MGRMISVKDMYKEKYPEQVNEKFPPKKETPEEFSPSERARMDEPEEEIVQKPRPKGTEPKVTKDKKKK